MSAPEGELTPFELTEQPPPVISPLLLGTEGTWEGASHAPLTHEFPDAHSASFLHWVAQALPLQP